MMQTFGEKSLGKGLQLQAPLTCSCLQLPECGDGVEQSGPERNESFPVSFLLGCRPLTSKSRRRHCFTMQLCPSCTRELTRKTMVFSKATGSYLRKATGFYRVFSLFPLNFHDAILTGCPAQACGSLAATLHCPHPLAPSAVSVSASVAALFL